MSEQPAKRIEGLDELVKACNSPEQIREAVHSFWQARGVKVDPTNLGLMWPEAVPQLSRIITLSSGRRMVVEATSQEDLDKGERIAREKYS